MMAFIASTWPAVLAFLLAAAGVVFGMFKQAAAKTAVAQAAASDAEANDDKHQAGDARADAQATAEALDKVQAAGTQRAQIDAAVAAAPEGEARKELQNEYGRD